ncbi:sugar ABC transporter substrate-binding protein [Aureimonas sp. AU40]|uniref:sugar ABC transporter substrate-binding protein n=1 Tax=Aureimonas sp. AU40 TaxID=1637747 RepID=UPI00078197F2|nr:substrate-binding domain-containing protein [Aureimonas sp. AU40]
MSFWFRKAPLDRRRLLRGVAAAGLLAALPLSSASAQDAPKDLHFSFANIQEQGELFKQLGDGLAKAADVAGIKLSRYNNKADGPTTSNNARLMVQEKPNVIIEYTGVEGIGASLKRTFDQAGIPFIAVNIPVPGGHWFNLVNKELGQDAAKIVVDAAKAKGWTGADTTVIVAQAAFAGVEVNDCVRYFYTTAAEMMGLDKVEPAEITAKTTTMGKTGIQVDGEGTLEDTYAAVKNVLQTVPQDRHILLFAVNDDSAIGAWRAVTESGRADKALIAGLGGSVAALKELRTNANWVGEGSIFMSDWGQYIMAMGVAITQGVTPPALTKSPQIVLSKQTVDKYYDANGKVILLPPLVPENAYLKDTGVLQKFKNVEGL